MTRRRGTPGPGPGSGDGLRLTANVRIWDILENQLKPKIGKNGKPGKPRKSYTVRWVVDGETFPRTFATYGLADSWRSKLLTYQREGTLFDIGTGLPEPLAREALSVSWYKLATSFVDMKWKDLAPKSRYSVAESLSRATAALTTTTRGAPDPKVLRQALEHYAFNTTARAAGPPPSDLAAAVEWISTNTVAMARFFDKTEAAALTRAALNRCATKVDDSGPVGANTIARRRAVLYGCLDYGVELGFIPTNPMNLLKWTAPKVVSEVDRRTVVNPAQARRFLDAVRDSGPRGTRLVAFFALQYWAALRPSEALQVRRSNFLDLPETGWGEGLLDESNPRGGRRWTNGGESREVRQLKHRPAGATRPFPVHPALVKVLLAHFDAFGIGPDDLLFLGPRGGLLAEWAYLETFHQARSIALTTEEIASPLLAVPYSLRHACVSTMLNAGISPTQVAEWAGQSVEVLLRVYAKCLVGRDKIDRQRFEEATREAFADAPPPPDVTESDDDQGEQAG
ncbi:tyrosine-type recombinase/integrase [Actinoplanes sp. NPDC051859]|uniref:tyrosine-type recombinase/integrase n=1 Tax=Actinoplanes sp. NPDC051859 TaxID=3363909 RepID=UPI0037938023